MSQVFPESITAEEMIVFVTSVGGGKMENK